MQAEPFAPGVFESQGRVTLKSGQTIPYKTVCQDNLFYDETGKALGSMFTYSYFRSDVENPETRPVIFHFNGGPGSGSMWLHAGLFAPLRIKFDDPEAVAQPFLPPYRVENNELCLIDVADLVFLDPVACGYGRLLDKDAGERFFGMEADADSFNDLIQSWLGRYHRWQSPKYLLGESYGTNRACLLAESLSGTAQDEYAPVNLSGLILLGSAIGTGDGENNYEGVEETLTLLPTAAATNWYHNRPTDDLAAFVEACYAFCREAYASALFQGDFLPEVQKDAVAEKVAYFSGLSKALVLELNLRIKKMDYLKQVLKDRGLEVGLYDSRFTLPLNKDFSMPRMVADDAAQAQFAAPFVAALSGPMKQALGITFDRKFYGSANTAGKNWKRTSYRHAAKALYASMRRNPRMNVLFCSGYYDMQCKMGEARYMMSHAGLPLNRVRHAVYPSGHMSYLGDAGAEAFAADVRAMVAGG
jgi:carboxypeptidase C (cathepsin A)